jgi:4-hydroxybenzoate polyprenyltransferase
MTSARPLPLAVDLDGTLCRANTIFEQVMLLLRERPWLAPALPFWLLGGRPAFKARLARHAPLDRIALPYQRAFVAYLEGEAAAGREIVLVTAADKSTASHVASLFPFFREGIGTDGPVNLAGSAKAEYLAKRYGEKGFAYAGNEHRDLKVWARAGAAVVVNPSRGLAAAAAKLCPVEKEFDDRPARLPTLLKALRPHQWLKNILIFVPVFTAHRLGDQSALVHSLMAFAAFCAAASGAYVLNDLMDLPSDRAHATKKRRPFASGDLPVELGVLLCPLLLTVSAVLSLSLPVSARWLLASYVVLTLLYTFLLKRLMLVDVLVLASLYAVRLVMGHLSTGIPLSRWLIAFALCMFLSLALLKRYCELRERSDGRAPGRGYHVDHLKIIDVTGVVTGCLAAAVIAFYAGGEHVKTLYATPAYMYALSPIFLVWILRMWRLGYKGEMHEDPVLFTLHDLFSVAIGALTVFIVMLAR